MLSVECYLLHVASWVLCLECPKMQFILCIVLILLRERIFRDVRDDGTCIAAMSRCQGITFHVYINNVDGFEESEKSRKRYIHDSMLEHGFSVIYFSATRSVWMKGH